VKITRVREQDGAWYYIQDLEARSPTTGRPKQKWHWLCRVDAGEPALLEALKQLLGEAPKPAGNLPGFVDEFRQVHFRTLTSFEVRKEYGRMFDVIAGAFANFDAHDVVPGDVEKFLNDNFSETPTAKKAYKARLSTFFSWCVRNQVKTRVTVNPCRELKLKSPPKRRGKFTPEIFWRLHDALPPVGQCFLLLEYLTRQRPTEIRLLRESQIGADYIDFTPTKTEGSSGEEVKVRITPEIRAALERARSLRPPRKIVKLKDDPYLIQSRDGDRFSKNGLYEIWRDARAAAGVPKVTTRDVRAYALSAMEARLRHARDPARRGARERDHHRGLPRPVPRAPERGAAAAAGEENATMKRELPPNLHFKDGRYYYVKTVDGKTAWHGLSRDASEAFAQYELVTRGELQLSPPGAWLEGEIIYLWRRSRARATADNIYFGLTTEDVRAMGEAHNWRCALTGMRFSRDRTDPDQTRPFAPSIDRIDSEKGYTSANCRIVCVAVNIALNAWGEGIFRQIALAYCRKNGLTNGKNLGTLSKRCLEIAELEIRRRDLKRQTEPNQ
jgi:integrase